MPLNLSDMPNNYALVAHATFLHNIIQEMVTDLIGVIVGKGTYNIQRK
jgi:hypothetical protein